MTLSYFQKKNATVLSESHQWRTLPNLFTLGRFFLVIPLGWAMADNSSLLFLSEIAVYVLLDMLDGHWARMRGEQTRVGRLLDSACDKVTALGLLGVAIWESLFPLWVLAPILMFSLAQLGVALWAVACRKHRSSRLPATYLLSVTGASLAVGYFSHPPFQTFAYGFAILASLNHIYYYGWLLCSEEQRRRVRLRFQHTLERIAWIRERWRSRQEGHAPSMRRWTLPNAITIGRTLLVIPVVFSLAQGSQAWLLWTAAFVVFDIVDGALARKLRQTSEIGRMLDIVADKLFFIVLGVTWWRLDMIGNDLAAVFAVRLLVVALTGVLAERVLRVLRPLALWSAPSNIALVLFILFPNPLWEMAAIAFALQLILHYPYQLYLTSFLCRPPSTL